MSGPFGAVGVGLKGEPLVPAPPVVQALSSAQAPAAAGTWWFWALASEKQVSTSLSVTGPF